MRAVIRTIIGLVFGLLAAIALLPAFSAFVDYPGSISATGGAFWIVVLFGGVLGMFARSIRKAFGRGILLAGLAVLALPLSMMLLSGRATHEVVSGADAGSAGAVALGSGIAAVAMTGVSAFVGFFFGAILIIIALVLLFGGRSEVIVIREGGDPIA